MIADFLMVFVALIALNTLITLALLCIVIWAITVTIKWSRK